MTISITTTTTTDAIYGRERSEGSHQIMCLVKRPSYELALAVPHAPQVTVRQDNSCLHVRLKMPCQSPAFVLDLETFKHFHEDLLCLLEYVQTERQKLGAPEFSYP
jgi:hypothetical protein